MKKNILLLCGGGSTEHDISLISANYIEDCLKNHKDFHLISVEIGKDLKWRLRKEGHEVELLFQRGLNIQHPQGGPGPIKIDLCIPCLHGFPGETGDIQSLLGLHGIPFIGSPAAASMVCFNKLNTKLWLEALKIPNTPFFFLAENSPDLQQEALNLFRKWKRVFIKATNQGSSIGCFPIDDEEKLGPAIAEAFKYSPYVLMEKLITGRELEVSVYEYGGEAHASLPGEIICPSKFYSFEEKYSPHSRTSTVVEALRIPDRTIQDLRRYSLQAFRALKLRHLARIDYFLSDDGNIFLNEINTFPGLTPISMFPKMLEHGGPTFSEFLIDCLNHST